ncbi:retrovirus-related pol polyprotein from transposon TNT 1-94 [Tanacetum coccineum]
MTDAKYNSQDEKAHSTILLSLSDEVLYEVADEETAAGVWKKLEKLYMTKSLTNKLLLKQRLFSLRMKKGSALKDHLDALNSILMDLKNVEVKIDDEDAALILLVSLPPSFENFVNSFVVGKDTITLEDVRSSLHSRELRHQASGTLESQAVGLSVTDQDRGRHQTQKGKGKGRYKDRSKSRPRGSNPRDTCNYCKEEGHWKFNCPKLKEKGQVAAVAKDDSGSERDAVVFWGREVISELIIIVTMQVVGIGTIRIKMHDGVVRTLTDVRHVPDLKKNLISLGVLDSKGFKYTSENGVLRVSKGALVVMKATKDLTMLWHMRLGHMSEKGMVILSKRGLLDNHKVANLEFCEHCIIEKQKLFPAVKGWLDEDLDNYHLKELRCSTQCHTQMSMWIISRGVVLLILLMEYKVLRDFLLHRSSINNSARLSNKFGGFYFSFKFDISGLLHHVITTIAYRIRDKDTSQSKQNLQSSSMTFIHKTLIIPSVLDSCFISSTVSEVKRYSANMRRTDADFSHAPPNEYSPSPDDKKQ